MSIRALVVEDVPELRRTIERHLRSRGLEVFATESIDVAVDALSRRPGYHVLLLDLGLPEGSGLEVLARLPRGVPRPATIVMTGDASVENAVGALRVGALDYLAKPFSIEALDATLARVIAYDGAPSGVHRVAAPTDLGAASAWRERYAPQMLGESQNLLSSLELLRRVSPTDCSILLHGETGTGKELAARAIHAASGRGAGPLVAVNCAAIPEQLIESELFGHSKGAYTGAQRERAGRFLAAHGGTLLLDEIGELPLAVQGKLLRALQEREIVPLGDDRPIPIDVRVIAATHRDLEDMVEKKKFREDLLYRLDVIRVELPPLRERAGDIRLLVSAFIDDSNRRRGTSVHGIDDDALAMLEAHGWPGNVRQLANVVERMVILRAEGMIVAEDVPERVRATERTAALEGDASVLPAQGIDLRAVLERFETAMLKQALERTRGNKNRAAALLKLNRTTLVEKLKKRGIGTMESDDETDNLLEAVG
ncbi:MAG: sigma-54-dependent Fis family transcriptional regulator [Deltaproteobacteria bacterium]|nr:sigma-54-dependent Fis family transcriptional regulator [Deltaproteobacteria bacterium]